MTPLLTVEDLRTDVLHEGEWKRAVDDVSFAVERGRALGVVGESGAGKTMLARSILRLTPAGVRVRHAGRVTLDGMSVLDAAPAELRRLWGRRMAIVLQDPLRSLNPVMRVEHQLAEALGHGRRPRGRAVRRQLAALLDEVGIAEPERRLRAYPHELSGGMRQRVTIAMALAGGPDLLVADEPTTALDVTVQAQILALLRREQREREMAMLLVSHDLTLVARHTDEVAVMYAGQIVERGPSAGVARAPRMPYTRALVDAAPRLEDGAAPPRPIPGRPPVLGDTAAGCRFAARCPLATQRCREQPPPLAGDGTWWVRCWTPLEAA